MTRKEKKAIELLKNKMELIEKMRPEYINEIIRICERFQSSLKILQKDTTIIPAQIIGVLYRNVEVLKNEILMLRIYVPGGGKGDNLPETGAKARQN